MVSYGSRYFFSLTVAQHTAGYLKYCLIRSATTEYRVLSANGSAALVECLMVSGIKHQIRIHLGLALGTPILGDSKVKARRVGWLQLILIAKPVPGFNINKLR